MAKGKFRQWLEWASHAETVHNILQAEFIRTLLLPMAMSAATAISGYMGGVQVMWILLAATLAFAATVHGLLRGSEYIERKNPRGKLRLVSPTVAMDLVPIANPNRAQRRAGHQNMPLRHLDKIQLGMDVHNDATFPISLFVEYAESEIEGITPPRTQYPRPAITIPPGVTFRCMDERMSMDNMPCKKLIGEFELRLKYGLPGKERFELTHAASVEIHLQPVGIITGINVSPKPTSTL